MMHNNILISGNITKTPELSFTTSGIPFVKLSIASTERRYNKEKGKWENGETTFFSAVAWRKLAENIALSVDTGDRVLASGSISTHRWEKDGEERSRDEVTLNTFAISVDFNPVLQNRVAREKGKNIDPSTDPFRVDAKEEETIPF